PPLQGHLAPPHLHSFPTRRSSDLGRGDCYLLLNIAVCSEMNFDIHERVAFSTSRCAINRADWYLCQNFENRVFASDAVRGLNLNGIPTSQVAAKIAIAQQVGLSIHGWN